MKIEQARRVCYLLWLFAALLSAPTLVARVCVEVSKHKDKDKTKTKMIAILGGREGDSILVYPRLGQTMALEVKLLLNCAFLIYLILSDHEIHPSNPVHL